MKYRVILSPDAMAGLSSAIHWYQQTNPDMVARFLLKTRATLNRIKKHPYSFPRIQGVIRRAVLHKFPYSILFVVKKQFVFILAIRHQRQSGIVPFSGNGYSGVRTE
ncbi:MAG TPA: type II toxin-antitoxin system RelE/ParE family toxin [Pyrinomonadaceae bacterium]|nr:type II toxin-antitoxin system RelE/ParE family toxin [Pyrinomonadaceae bacterium]